MSSVHLRGDDLCRNLNWISVSLWFYITSAFFFFLRFLGKYFSRSRNEYEDFNLLDSGFEEDEKRKVEEEEEELEEEEEEKVEEETEIEKKYSNLGFKFDHKLFDKDWRRSNEDPEESDTEKAQNFVKFHMLKSPELGVLEQNSLSLLRNSADFFDFGTTDSDWSSTDGGYSVKDLTFDSDSDDLLSETDSPPPKIRKTENSGDQPLLDGSEDQSENLKTKNDLKIPMEEDEDESFSEESSKTQPPTLVELSDGDFLHGGDQTHLTKGLFNSNHVDQSFDPGVNGGEEESDELDSMWEHEDLIEQLKMELKKARSFGLPTIIEESESPKSAAAAAAAEEVESPKKHSFPLKNSVDDDLEKLYKSYKERMRKLDVLNYQKMYAIGFLQLKDPLESMVPQKVRRSRRRPSGGSDGDGNPSDRLTKEKLKSEMEMVYVGQMCLTWEFLRWQYEKTRERQEYDNRRHCQYNLVAGEFQRFTVNMQRFMENESFQGPRLTNYLKTRCVLRNILQAPLIKEDCWNKEMKVKRHEEEESIGNERLQEMMEESIRVFWEFVKSDNDNTAATTGGLIFMKPFAMAWIADQLLDPSDLPLFIEAQASLHKKEKKLKEILKAGNCIIRKFKKHHQVDPSNHEILFSQVDLKLVSRVLKMPRITSEQLVWCQMKLNKINFVGRKISRETCFLLFPC